MPSKRSLEFVSSIASFLKEHSITDAEREAELLLTFATGIDRVSLYRDNPAISPAHEEKLNAMVARRARHEPVQYIIGSVEFFGLKIDVGPGVLIPRPETELLVEEAINRLKRSPNRMERHDCVLDLCTGSGCVAIAVAKGLPSAKLWATDDSAAALGYARSNAGKNAIGNITYLEGPLFEPVTGMKFDAILSNPPYIPSAEVETLAPEVKDWEPREALDGGPDGLAFYRLILKEAGLYLNAGGFVAFEMGAGQAGDITLIAKENGLTPVKIVKDYAGIERVMVITRNEPGVTDPGDKSR